ncbi:MFS transporter [Wenzhouxiangella sp. XN79A]|uniref:MFS transporter n=1 Tax=Wenzhouxiangella sp. XN79A TaxID=2724193 RepID=UPI00144AA1FA|nr:MFS transporter [Wenzhouxiangella sp. XN79A]NKI35230.1 MFS transporter [Wenzhouxiangella sp. XN79A]
MHAITAVFTLLLGVAVILAGSGLLGTLLGVRGPLEGMSAGTLGLIMSGYFVGYVGGTLLVPKLIRQVGHIRTFAALASLVSIVSLLHGLFVSPALWFLLRFVAGVCVVGLYIAIESWLNERTGNEERGNVFSAYMTTTLIGLAVGQLLLLTGDVSQLELFALASVLLSLGLVPVALTQVREPPVVDADRLGLRKLFEISPVGVVACVFSGLGISAFWGLGPVFAGGLGFDPDGISLYMSLTILGGIVMMWPVGRLSDRIERRRVLMMVCAMTAVGAIATLLLIPYGAWAVKVGGFVYGCFAFSIFSLAAAHTNDHVAPDQILEVTSSLQLLWGSGAIVGPIVAGLLIQQFGPEALMAWFAVAALIPAVFIRYRMTVTRPIPMDEQADFVPQFATSPAALEMHPEVEESDQTVEPTAPAP